MGRDFHKLREKGGLGGGGFARDAAWAPDSGAQAAAGEWTALGNVDAPTDRAPDVRGERRRFGLSGRDITLRPPIVDGEGTKDPTSTPPLSRSEFEWQLCGRASSIPASSPPEYRPAPQPPPDHN